MSLQTYLASGTTTLGNLREKSSILLTTSTGVALLGTGLSRYEASWASDERRAILLNHCPVIGNNCLNDGLAAVIPTVSVEVELIKDSELSPLQVLQNLSTASQDKKICIKVIDNESKTARKSHLTTVIAGPSILPILGCVLQYKNQLCVALYRKGFNCIHLLYYFKDRLSDKCIDSEPALVPFDPPTIALPAPIHGVASLHDYNAFIIATCERSCSALYMKPDTSFEVKLHSCLILDTSTKEEQSLGQITVPKASTIGNLAADHACQAFSMVMKFATDHELSAQEKASLITAMGSVYDSALRAIYTGIRS